MDLERYDTDGHDTWHCEGETAACVVVINEHTDTWHCQGETPTCADELAAAINEHISEADAHAREGVVIIEPVHECPPCPDVAPLWVILVVMMIGMMAGWIIGLRTP